MFTFIAFMTIFFVTIFLLVGMVASATYKPSQPQSVPQYQQEFNNPFYGQGPDAFYTWYEWEMDDPDNPFANYDDC